MKILKYEYSEPYIKKWKFQEIEFGRVNLIVGNSGSGKSVLLNTIFDLGKNSVRKEDLKLGHWKISFKLDNAIYDYEIDNSLNEKTNKIIVKKEVLNINSSGRIKQIIRRDENNFYFNDNELPKLSSEISGICLLQDEVEIRTIFQGYQLMLKRDFGEAAIKSDSNIIFPTNKGYEKGKNIKENQYLISNINLRFKFLKDNYIEIYRRIIQEYKEIFTFVKEIDIIDSRDVNPSAQSTYIPVLAVKEKGISQWIKLGDVSTGMYKVLVILSDLFILQNGSIYLIDEYENSLGINAISFLPRIIDSIENDIQLFITTHNPYLINNIPIENWIILNRKGTKIQARFGEKNKEFYGKSKHDQFIKLINDPFYNEVL